MSVYSVCFMCLRSKENVIVCNNNGLQGKPGSSDRITAYKIISLATIFKQQALQDSRLTPSNLQVLFKAAPCMLLLVAVFQAVTVEYT